LTRTRQLEPRAHQAPQAWPGPDGPLKLRPPCCNRLAVEPPSQDPAKSPPLPSGSSAAIEHRPARAHHGCSPPQDAASSSSQHRRTRTALSAPLPGRGRASSRPPWRREGRVAAGGVARALPGNLCRRRRLGRERGGGGRRPAGGDATSPSGVRGGGGWAFELGWDLFLSRMLWRGEQSGGARRARQCS
jgi:hypothetical protein